VSVQLFNGALGASFTPSSTLMLVAGQLTLDFLVVASSGPTTLKYFLEFSADGVTFFPETAEEDAGGGVVLMPLVLRTLADNGGTAIANNTAFKASCQFVRQHKFARVQMQVTAGAASVTLSALFGAIPIFP
jgi:hypothetical protein